MLWVTAVTLFDRARELEDWGMEAITETFPGFIVNKIDSALSKRYVSLDQPNECYWQPVREYLGTAYAFARDRKQLTLRKARAGVTLTLAGGSSIHMYREWRSQ